MEWGQPGMQDKDVLGFMMPLCVPCLSTKLRELKPF